VGISLAAREVDAMKRHIRRQQTMGRQING
jgi:hypothetical protein